MFPILPAAIVLPLVAFYVWMLRDLAHNDDLTSNPWMLLGIARNYGQPVNLKYNWTLAFIFLNVFAAAMYFAAEYRKR